MQGTQETQRTQATHAPKRKHRSSVQFLALRKLRCMKTGLIAIVAVGVYYA